MSTSGQINSLTSLFDSFYTRFVMRDILAKVIPGSILLVFISATILSLPKVISSINSMSFGLCIVGGGAAWLVGFIVQSFGEMFKLIRYFPKKISWDDEIENILAFLEVASYDEKLQFERFVVIKEACGNGYVALLVSFLFSIFIKVLESLFTLSFTHSLLSTNSWLYGIGIALWVLAIIFLRRMHFEHVTRQHNFLYKGLNHHNLHETSSNDASCQSMK